MGYKTCLYPPFLIRDIRQQCHKSSTFDGNRHGVLTDCRATAFSSVQDFPLATRQFFEQFDILVIDEHRSGTLTANHQRVFLRNRNSRFGLLALLLFGFFGKRGHLVALNDSTRSARPRASFYSVFLTFQAPAMGSQPTAGRLVRQCRLLGCVQIL